MATLKIQNRLGQDMFVHIDYACWGSSDAVVFLHHGFGDSALDAHMIKTAEILNDRGFTVFSLDATNSQNPRNKSSGKFEDFTLDQHILDMEDMIVWAQQEMYVNGPFTLAGHGMGAFAAMKLAANGFRAKTEAIIAISPLINGQQHIDNVIHVARRAYFNAETSGFWDFSNEEGEHTKYPHEKFIALKNYNLETEIPYLTMPVHFIASNMDKEDHISDLRAFVGQLPTSGTFHNIENSSVTFSNTQRKFRAALTVIAERINPAVKPIDPSYVLD